MISLIHIHQLYKLVYANIDYTLRYSKGLSLKSLIGLYHLIVLYIKTTLKCLFTPKMVTAICLCLRGCNIIFWSSGVHYSGSSSSNFVNWKILKLKLKRKRKILLGSANITIRENLKSFVMTKLIMATLLLIV